MTRRLTYIALAALAAVAGTGIATGSSRWHNAVERARAAGADAERRWRDHGPDWARGEGERACQLVVESATGEPDGIDAPMTRCLWHVACHQWLQRPVAATWHRCQVEIGER